MDQTSQPQPAAEPAPVKKKSTRTIWAIICLVGPTALLIFTFIVFAIVNWTTSASLSSDSYTEGPTIVRTIVNVVLWLIGALATLSWLPGIIVGIILLATKPAAPKQ